MNKNTFKDFISKLKSKFSSSERRGTSFGALYKGELKKSFSLKTALIFALIAVAGIAVMSLAVSLMSDVDYGGEYEDGDKDAPQEISYTYAQSTDPTAEQCQTVSFTQSEIAALIRKAELNLDYAKEQKDEFGYKYYIYNNSLDIVNAAKSELALYEYIRDNALYNQELYIFGSTAGILYSALGGGTSADSYVAFLMLSMLFLVAVYAVVVASGTFAQEMKNGTLKLVLMRPITRNKLTSAKLLSTITIASAAYILMFLAIVIIGYSSFPSPAVKTLFVFNAHTVFTADISFLVFIVFLFGYIQVAGLTVIAFALGALSGNRALSIAIPLLCAMDLLGVIVDFSGLGRFFITGALDLSVYFGIHGLTPAGGNFWLALAVYILYIGGLIAGTYTVFKKRDAA